MHSDLVIVLSVVTVTGIDLIERLLLSLPLRLLPIDEVESLCLNCAVNEGTDSGGSKLLSLLVTRGLSIVRFMVFVRLGRLVRCGSGNQFVTQFSLVRGLVNLVVSIGGILLVVTAAPERHLRWMV